MREFVAVTILLDSDFLRQLSSRAFDNNVEKRCANR